MCKMAKEQTEQNNYFESCKIYRFNKTKEKNVRVLQLSFERSNRHKVPK